MGINNQLRELIKSGTFAGILLIIAFTLAIIVSNNIFLAKYYSSFIYSKFSLTLGNVSLQTTFIELVNGRSHDLLLFINRFRDEISPSRR